MKTTSPVCHPAASLSPACCVPSRSPRRPSCVFFSAATAGFQTPPHDKNFVRLVDAKTGAELKRAYPPRNDTGRPVRWKLTPGKKVTVEVVDGDTGAAFAWIGVTRFSIDLDLFSERRMISSLRPGGERLTGVFRSAEFEVPGLTFTITGTAATLTDRRTAKIIFNWSTLPLGAC